MTLASRLQAVLAARNIHYGWVVVATTFLAMLATAGALGSPGVMIVPLQHEFGWSTADISFALAVRLILFGLMGPFAAAFMNHFGIRPVVATALILISSGILLSLAMTEVWQLVLLWGVVVGLGTGMTALVLGVTVATRWFARRRGLVVGMLTASTATGQLVFLPLLAELTQAVGWRLALCLVVAALMIAMLLILLLMQDRPSDLRLPAYGATHVEPAQVHRQSLPAMLLSPIVTLRDVSTSTTFWALFATFFVCGASTNGLIQTHWITLCGDYGLAPVGAAGILAAIGVFDFLGTIGSGWLSDRFDNRRLLFCYYGLRGLSLLFLPFTDFSVYGLSLFAVFYGLDWVATVPPTVRLTADRFGKERANVTFGWIFTGHQLGAAAAAYGGGAARDTFASYTPALFTAGALCLLAALLALTIRKQPGGMTSKALPASARAGSA